MSEKDQENKTNPLSVIVWTIDNIQVDYQKEVPQIQDFLGIIGGLFEVIMFLIFVIFGNYLDFVAKLRWFK